MHSMDSDMKICILNPIGKLNPQIKEKYEDEESEKAGLFI